MKFHIYAYRRGLQPATAALLRRNIRYFVLSLPLILKFIWYFTIYIRLCQAVILIYFVISIEVNDVRHFY